MRRRSSEDRNAHCFAFGFGPRLPGVTVKSSGTNQLRPISRAPFMRRCLQNCCTRSMLRPSLFAASRLEIVFPITSSLDAGI
jgi:hypothetical protein